MEPIDKKTWYAESHTDGIRVIAIKNTKEHQHLLKKIEIRINKRIFRTNKIKLYYCAQCEKYFVLEEKRRKLEDICRKNNVPIILSFFEENVPDTCVSEEAFRTDSYNSYEQTINSMTADYKQSLLTFMIILKEISQKCKKDCGLSLKQEEVFEDDEELHRDGCDWIFLGKRYSSQTELARDFGVSPASFNLHLKKGWTCKQALGLEEFIPPKVYFQGVEYDSEKSLAEAFGVVFTTYKSRLAHGWSQEEALGIVPHISLPQKLPKVYFQGVEYDSEKSLAEAFGVAFATYKMRLAHGWSQEEALSITPRRQANKQKSKNAKVNSGKDSEYNICTDETSDESDKLKKEYFPTEDISDKWHHEFAIAWIEITQKLLLGQNSYEFKEEKENVSESQQEYSWPTYNPLGADYDNFCAEWTSITNKLLYGEYFDINELEKSKQTFDIWKKTENEPQNIVQTQTIVKDKSSSHVTNDDIYLFRFIKGSRDGSGVIGNSLLNMKTIERLKNIHSYKQKQYNYNQKERIFELLYYLKYSISGEVYPPQLEAVACEVYEWLCINVGYNRRLGKYSITEYAYLVYEEIVSWQSDMTNHFLLQIARDIKQLIFRVTRYFGADKDIDKHFTFESAIEDIHVDFEDDVIVTQNAFDDSLLEQIRRDSADMEELLSIDYSDEWDTFSDITSDLDFLPEEVDLDFYNSNDDIKELMLCLCDSQIPI